MHFSLSLLFLLSKEKAGKTFSSISLVLSFLPHSRIISVFIFISPSLSSFSRQRKRSLGRFPSVISLVHPFFFPFIHNSLFSRFFFVFLCPLFLLLSISLTPSFSFFPFPFYILFPLSLLLDVSYKRGVCVLFFFTSLSFCHPLPISFPFLLPYLSLSPSFLFPPTSLPIFFSLCLSPYLSLLQIICLWVPSVSVSLTACLPVFFFVFLSNLGSSHSFFFMCPLHFISFFFLFLSWIFSFQLLLVPNFAFHFSLAPTFFFCIPFPSSIILSLSIITIYVYPVSLHYLHYFSTLSPAGSSPSSLFLLSLYLKTFPKTCANPESFVFVKNASAPVVQS